MNTIAFENYNQLIN